MTCPLIVEGRAVGFLFRSSRKPNAYDRHHVRLHQAVAERLSQAVEKAYRIEQLTAANRAYFEMLGFVSHELRSPLASIVMDVEMFKGGYLGPLEDRQKEKLERMAAKAQYLLGMIGDYLNLARIEGDEMALKIRDGVDFISDVIDPSLDLIASLIEEKHVLVHREIAPGPLHVECDPSLLAIVMVNLIGNAVKYGEKNGKIRLRAACDEGVLRVSVWNRGPGFPTDQKSKLFRKFSRIETRELLQRKGTGVGLYTTWRIIQLHQGRIGADSEHGQWAEFTFEIPQPIPGAKQAKI
jgi:signal transduction histidine kinase